MLCDEFLHIITQQRHYLTAPYLIYNFPTFLSLYTYIFCAKSADSYVKVEIFLLCSVETTYRCFVRNSIIVLSSRYCVLYFSILQCAL